MTTHDHMRVHQRTVTWRYFDYAQTKAMPKHYPHRHCHGLSSITFTNVGTRNNTTAARKITACNDLIWPQLNMATHDHMTTCVHDTYSPDAILTMHRRCVVDDRVVAKSRTHNNSTGSKSTQKRHMRLLFWYQRFQRFELCVDRAGDNTAANCHAHSLHKPQQTNNCME